MMIPTPLVPSRVRSTVRQRERQAQERQRLLVEMLPLVKHMAFKIREHLPSHVELDDLLGNGVLGLVDAISKFDTSKQVKLESYARHRVRGSILDGLRGADPASRDLRRKNKQIQKLYRELEVKVGRPVKDEEIARVLGLSLAQWHHTLDEIQSVGFDCGTRTVTAGPTTKRTSAEPALLTDQGADPFVPARARPPRRGALLGHFVDRPLGLLVATLCATSAATAANESWKLTPRIASGSSATIASTASARLRMESARRSRMTAPSTISVMISARSVPTREPVARS